MADYPSIPFRNATAGPAGEYSDAYKAIVEQYRNDVDSASRLRNFQEDERAMAAGTPPPSLVAMRTGLQQPRMAQPHYLKSGQDWYQVGANGQPQLVVDAPDVVRNNGIIPEAQLPNVPIPEGYDAVPYGVGGFKIMPQRQKTVLEQAMALTGGGTNAPALPAMNPQPALAPPTTQTVTAPAYRPAPMMAPDEVAPPGSIVIGRRKPLDAPPRTTQATERVLDAATAKQILAQANGDKAKAREMATQLGYSFK